MRRTFRPSLTLGLVLFAAVGCDHSTAPRPRPAAIRLSTTSVVGIIGLAVVPSPTFTVVDAEERVLPDIPVTVSVGSGGGTLSGAPTMSGSEPVSIGSWVLGPLPGVNSVTVSVAGLSPATVAANAKSAYRIDLRFYGAPIDPVVRAAFEAAKIRIETIITAAVPDVLVGSFDASVCGVTGGGTISLPVRGVIIYAAVDSIDGPGKVLGTSGPCFARAPGNIPFLSVMHFDVADLAGLVADGRINNVILHEMLHAVGVGTSWRYSPGTLDSGGAYVGAAALAACRALGGATLCSGSVPLERCGGPGTADFHWRKPGIERCPTGGGGGPGFQTELMTGWIPPPGTPNPLSRVTIGSLADLGYSVNMDAADPYAVPGSLAAVYADIAEARGHGGFELRETLTQPRFAVDPRGRIRPLVP